MLEAPGVQRVVCIVIHGGLTKVSREMKLVKRVCKGYIVSLILGYVDNY